MIASNGELPSIIQTDCMRSVIEIHLEDLRGDPIPSAQGLLRFSQQDRIPLVE